MKTQYVISKYRQSAEIIDRFPDTQEAGKLTKTVDKTLTG
jgi:hypothetical protein